MADWVRNNAAAINGSANSNLTGSVDLDNDTAPADFDPAGVTSVTVEVTVTITGRVDDTFSMTTAEGWEVRQGGGGTTLATSGYDTGTGTGFTSSNTASGTDNAPDTGQSQALWEGAELDDGGTSNAWAVYVQEMKGDDATLDIAAGDITVTITYTPSATPAGILNLLAAQE